MNSFPNLNPVYELAPHQRLLMQALLSGKQQGEDAYAKWVKEVDFVQMHGNALRVIPALFRKFSRSQLTNPHWERMRGIYRFFHYWNSTVLATARRTLARFQDAGIDVLVFKGIALALKYHDSSATRPIGDIDVLVRPGDVERADKLLFELGWKYLPGYEPAIKRSLHAQSYVNSQRVGFDLHWFSLLESPRPGVDAEAWHRAEFFDWDGCVLKMMSPEDLLITGIVNGVRGSGPIGLHWILDLTKILAKEPVILWPEFWDEAGKRGLRDTILDALRLVGELAPEVVPESLLASLLRLDPTFEQRYVESAIAEGRRSEAPAGSRAGASPGTAAQYIRYLLDDDQAIVGLTLQRRLLPFVAQVFDIEDPVRLETLIAGLPCSDEVTLRLPPGMLAFKDYSALPSGPAEILISRVPVGTCAPGDVLCIGLEVANTSPQFWIVRADQGENFGVSCHLLSDAGAVLTWEMPRAYLAKEWKGYVAFVAPGQKIERTLEIVAPRRPGRYALQFDLVQERVAWFSSMGIQFPRIEFEVRGEGFEAPRPAIGPGIVHETVDGEALIVNTREGAYFTADGYAAQIWNAVACGYDPAQISAAFALLGPQAPAADDVSRFVADLAAEQLLHITESASPAPRGELRVNALAGAGPPVLQRYASLPELIAMHPARDVSPSRGWPHRVPALK